MKKLFIALFSCCLGSVSLASSSVCIAGQVSLEGGITSLVQCIQNDNPGLFPINNSDTPEANYLYVVTDNTNHIIVHFLADTGYDMDAHSQGNYRIHGFSYTGTLNTGSIQAGQPIEGISSDACFSYSSNFISIARNSCEAINCQGGNIFTSEGDTYISMCMDGVPDNFIFTTTSTGNANYTYIIADSNGLIVDVTANNEFDFEGLLPGHYTVTGLSYHGELITSTIAAGQPLSAIQTNGFCIEPSAYSIGVDIAECTLGEGCTHLYFSEYIEGTQNNRALEIYNPTPFPVNLGDYDIFVYTNGASTELPIMALSGTLQPGDVYVIAHAQASADILSQADITASVATFSGNDAIALMYNLEPVDIIGIIGQDPGLNGWTWQNGTGLSSTTNHTLVRKPHVNAPTTNWTLSRGQWHVYEENDFSHIGSHDAEACLGLAYLGFENTAMMVQEDIGTFEVTVQGFNITGPIDATVSVIAGSATADVDYVNSFPVILHFTPAQTIQTFSIEIIDDDEMEGYEYFTLQITEPSGLVSFVNQQLTINIAHSDQAYPDYTIAVVTTNDNFGSADSLDVFCTLGGVVHGLNLNAAGTEFTLIENHSGIKVFDPSNGHGYTVTEGDSVRVRGRVGQFYGMTLFYADAITYISSGNALNIPQPVTEITEEHESAMIMLECVTLVDPTQWTNLTSGFDVEVTDGTHQYIMHIDLDTDLYGQPPLDGSFNVIGVGAQKDETSPYNSGYSIWPRYTEDIGGRVIASFEHGNEFIFGDNGATVTFENNSTGATDYSWHFGDTQTSTQENPTHSYPFNFFIGIADITITLTATNDVGCSDTYSQTMDVVYSSVEEIASAQFVCYPNPLKDLLTIRSEENIHVLRIYNGVGKMIYLREGLNQPMIELETNSWATGIYFLEVESNRSVAVQKLIKP